jgi:hypothetical protein
MNIHFDSFRVMRGHHMFSVMRMMSGGDLSQGSAVMSFMMMRSRLNGHSWGN